MAIANEAASYMKEDDSASVSTKWNQSCGPMHFYAMSDWAIHPTSTRAEMAWVTGQTKSMQRCLRATSNVWRPTSLQKRQIQCESLHLKMRWKHSTFAFILPWCRNSMASLRQHDARAVALRRCWCKNVHNWWHFPSYLCIAFWCHSEFVKTLIVWRDFNLLDRTFTDYMIYARYARCDFLLGPGDACVPGLPHDTGGNYGNRGHAPWGRCTGRA